MEEKDSKKISKTTKTIIVLVIVLAIIIAFGIGGYFAYNYSYVSKSTGTEWGDTYYSYLKSVKEADEEKIKDAGLTKDIKTAKVEFIQVNKEDNPKMALTFEKNNESYTNIYFIEQEQKVNVITYDHPTTLKLMYNRELDRYLWYLYSKENDENMYKSLEKIMKDTKTAEPATEENEPEAVFADYTFKDNEMESKLDVAEGETPVVSKFDKTFIEVDIDDQNIKEINFEENDKDLKQSITSSVEEYKPKDKIVTEEIKTKIEEEDKNLDKKQEEIKQIEEKKKAEEAAKKAAEEEAKRKAEEEAAKKAAEEAEKKAQNSKISKEQAAKLAEKLDGTKDSDTGFEIGYSLEAMIKDSSGLEYYLFRVRWLVDHSHWSTIDGVAISVDGKKWKKVDIYDNYQDGQTMREIYSQGTF